MRFLRRLAFAAVLVAGALFLASYVVKRTVQSWGSRAVGAPVSIASFRPTFPDAGLTLRGVEIRNPPGFLDEPAISIQRLVIDVDLGSLFGDVITVDEIAAERVEVHFSRADGRTNLDAIEHNITAELRTRGLVAKPRVIITRLAASGGRATASALVGRVTVPLEDIEYRDIGRKENGLPPPALTAEFFDLMEPSLGKALAHTDYGGLFGKGAKGVGRGVKKAVRKLKGLFK